MTNKKFWLGIQAMVLLFGMAIVGCDNGSTNGGNTIPSELQGTWKWVRGEFGHEILLEIGSSSIKNIVTSDPDTSKNGTTVFNITNVSKGSTAGGWTTYNVTVENMGTFSWEINADKDQIRDPNGLPADGYPRIFYKQ